MNLEEITKGMEAIEIRNDRIYLWDGEKTKVFFDPDGILDMGKVNVYNGSHNSNLYLMNSNYQTFDDLNKVKGKIIVVIDLENKKIHYDKNYLSQW